MSTLRLAENGRVAGVNYYQSLAQNGDPRELYVFVPDDAMGRTGIWVREDAFDDLDDASYEEVMSVLQPYQDETQLGLRLFGIGKRSPKQQARYDRRQERKQEKHDLKVAKKQAKIDLIQAKASGEVPTFGGSIGQAISGIFGGQQAPMDQPVATPRRFAGQMPQRQFSLDVQAGQTQRPNLRPWIIGGGLALLLIGIGVAVTRKKR